MSKQVSDTTEYLDKINNPADLRALPREAMPALAAEIRTFLIDKVKKSGGHLASNLGVVELTIALHRVFDTPKDHLIWDVGHQSYVHKILTGRKDRFDELRQVGGLSGFTTRKESEYDPFGAGHSSTSASAALGFAEADRIAGRDAFTVAVIGDGAFTGGMVHEALNNSSPDLPLILVLNENEMSISRNTGAFASYIAGIRASHSYLLTKKRTVDFLQKLPLLGKPLYRAVRGIVKFIKKRIYRGNYFEDLGFLYLGPVDGNDYNRVERVLKKAKAHGGAVVVHIKTKKGLGYSPAENDPSTYHNTHAPCSDKKGSSTFHAVFGEELTALAREDKRICAITAAMGLGCGLDGFRAAFPDRFFDVGIAEEHAATFAAGMAANGMVPCFAVYSTFLQRAYDNVLHDIALQDLPVKLFIDRAGLASADGATHHGIFDVSFLSGIPHMHIFAPACYASMRAMMKHVMALPYPAALRYPNECEDARVAPHFYPNEDFDAYGVRADFPIDAIPETVILTYGNIVSEALDAQEQCADKPGILLLEELKPYDQLANKIAPYLRKDTRVLFLEEGVECGGAASEIRLALSREMGENAPKAFEILAIRDHFATPTEPTDLRRFCGISSADILARLS